MTLNPSEDVPPTPGVAQAAQGYRLYEIEVAELLASVFAARVRVDFGNGLEERVNTFELLL